MDASPVAPGQILAGKYRIERVLGEGGMGVVVEAHDTGLERRVAIKFLLPDFVKHVEAKERFLREARAAVKIQSEHVARVIDVSTLESGAPYMVMEFLEGSDLSRVIETAGPLSVEDAALYVIQACEALAEAHAHGIIHRDLKPANLFLAQQAGGSRKIKVLDFGISKTLNSADAKASGSLTRTSSMMGSPLYMSPEQMKSARDVDLRTDIWALGVILYEALTGNPPFLGDSIPEISAKILLEEPRPLSEVRPSVPQLLSDVTARALQKQPDKRFSNVGELAVALLPFAPGRARSHVERITRVLEAAGFAKSDFLASAPPPPLAAATSQDVLEPVPRPSGALAEGGGRRKGATLANWGQTQMEAANGSARSSRLLLGAALGSVAAVAAVIGLVVHFASGPAPGAAAPAPSAAAAPAVEAPAPKVAVVTAEESAESGAEARPAPEEKEPERAAPEPAAPAAKPKPKPAAAKKTRAPASAPVHTASASAVVKPKEKSHTGDFTSKFGSRK
ncbi:MAG TPA: serine/threonine-protein kinase [Polyangiaceae bacterium]|nr:serine/threonine-protein kinase [Polyangiaceae bacterium]